MILEKLLDEIKNNIEAVVARRSALGQSLWQEFIRLHPADIAKLLGTLSEENFKKLFASLPQEINCKVFKEFNEPMQRLALSFLNDTGRVDALSCLTADELTDLFEGLSDKDLKEYLDLLHKKDREKVLSLLKFPPESAGGIMDTEVFALTEDFTVHKSIQLIQRLQLRKELHHQIYIIDGKKRLVGNIRLEDLVLQKPQARIRAFMRPNELVAYAEEDQEIVAQKMVHYNVTTVPVVGKDNYFLGIIPSTTLVDIIEEEASEDVYKMAALEPVKGGTYFDLSFWRIIYQRSYILIVLLLAQSLSSAIIELHEALLAGFLVRFITMLVSTGGNASSQTSTLIIQGMASGEINKDNMHRFLKREVAVAVVMACILGITAFGRVYVTSHNIVGSFAVSLSLAAIVVVSVIVGSTFPLVLKHLKIDPAYSAGPFLATMMDVLGLLIYCAISKHFFC